MRLFCFKTPIVSFLLLIVGLLTADASEPEHRIALVIGNGAYTHTGALPNPANDARLVGSRLALLGFETMIFVDLGGSRMRRALRSYSERLIDLGPNTIGLIYYAGHGVQIRENNYLIPVDAQINKESDAGIEAIHLADVLNLLFDAQNKLNVIILDACRNNPFKKKIHVSATRLAAFDAPVGTLVAFAAATGRAALDGAGTNSPYAEALSTALLDPGLKVEDTFKRVSERVYMATGKQQLPWITAAVHGDYYLATSNSTPQDAAEKNSMTVAAREARELASTEVVAGSVDDTLKGRIAYFIEWRFFAGDNGAQALGPDAYANKLDYYGKKDVPREEVLRDKAHYYLRWPNRRFALVRDTLQVQEVAPGVFDVTFRFKFDVENTKKRSVGLSDMKLGLRKMGHDFVILRQDEVIQKRTVTDD
jgi:uncharacterized caspase-like protein